MPIPPVTDTTQLTLGGVPAKRLVQVVKPYRSDRPGILAEAAALADAEAARVGAEAAALAEAAATKTTKKGRK